MQPLFIQKRSFLTDCIWFVCAVSVIHVLWRVCIHPVYLGNYTTQVFFLSCDVTSFFDWWCRWQAKVAAWLLGSDVLLVGTTMHSLSDPYHSIGVVWSCSAIKQVLILLIALTAAHGPAKHKCWYIPVSVVVCFVFNCLRIAFIAGVSFKNFDWFAPLHQSLKYVFYGLLFVLWVVWEEKFAKHESVS
ncbi:MAG: hypothetical protein J5808_04355 [Paludibacteraceae bacterium]|nr:hypothetical protein [Paludibacteraceae bacterium]